MAWTYEQKFNALSNGDLNGQDSWSGDTDFDVIDTLFCEGGKSVRAINANGYVARAITAVSDGVFYIAMMRPDTAGDAEFNLRTGSNTSDWMKVIMESSNIELVHAGGTQNLVTSYVVGRWYLFKVTIISTSSFKVEVSTGGAYSDPLGAKTPINTGSVDTIRLGCGGTGNGYWDTISPTDPMTLIDTMLISYWNCDTSGSLIDIVGPNDLTNQNSVSNVSGLINNCADFEASSTQFFEITDASQSGLDLGNAFTISFWFDPESFSGDQLILGKYTVTGNQRSYLVYWNFTNDTINLATSATGSSTINDQGWVVNLSNGWYHILISLDSSGIATLYLNGASQGTKSGYGTPFNATAPFTLGQVNGGNYVDGKIDELGIWSRPLTAAEALRLYNGGAGLAYPFPNVYTQILDEIVTVVDSMNKSFSRSFVEVASIFDTLVSGRLITLALTETISVIDSTIGQIYRFAKGFILGRNNDTNTSIGIRRGGVK